MLIPIYMLLLLFTYVSGTTITRRRFGREVEPVGGEPLHPQYCKIPADEPADFYFCPYNKSDVNADKHCISYSQLCNHKRDCPNGEDEDPDECIYHREKTIESMKLLQLLRKDKTYEMELRQRLALLEEKKRRASQKQTRKPRSTTPEMARIRKMRQEKQISDFQQLLKEQKRLQAMEQVRRKQDN